MVSGLASESKWFSCQTINRTISGLDSGVVHCRTWVYYNRYFPVKVLMSDDSTLVPKWKIYAILFVIINSFISHRSHYKCLCQRQCRISKMQGW